LAESRICTKKTGYAKVSINNYRIKKSSPENPVNPVQENKMAIFAER
jgi:hypothetical protein